MTDKHDYKFMSGMEKRTSKKLLTTSSDIKH